MLHLILPSTQATLKKTYYELPLYFLAGPIAGGDDWQMKLTDMLVKNVGDCIVVNPSRYGPKHPLYRFRLNGTHEFPSQTLWERHYLRKAGFEWPGRGCIIFWLPGESERHPRTDGNPYAVDTRGELGEWRGHLMYNPAQVRLVIGAEPDFPALRTIKRNFDAALGRNYTIYDSMRAVVDCAARYTRRFR